MIRYGTSRYGRGLFDGAVLVAGYGTNTVSDGYSASRLTLRMGAYELSPNQTAGYVGVKRVRGLAGAESSTSGGYSIMSYLNRIFALSTTLSMARAGVKRTRGMAVKDDTVSTAYAQLTDLWAFPGFGAGAWDAVADPTGTWTPVADPAGTWAEE